MSKLELNEKQREAVSHNTGPMMVLAGPGSGKTTVIIHRIKTLIEKYNVLPKDILVITFTKAAANEMKSRFNGIDKQNSNVTFGTFHSYFFRILRNSFGFTLDNVIRDDEKKAIIQRIIKEKELIIDDEEEYISNIMNEISLVKSELENYDNHKSSNFGQSEFASIYVAYENIKSENAKIDFDDMVCKCYELLQQNPDVLKRWKDRYKYILIDEFQDINNAQYQCIRLLTERNSNIFIVGDDDQSIYKFRGARPEFLLKFPDDFDNVQKIILDTNYRSTNQIINLCNAVIKNNSNRYEKIIKGTKKEGNMPVLIKSDDISTEANEIAKKVISYVDRFKLSYDRIAVIYRTNIQARAIVDAFMDFNIPYQIKDEIPSIYEHRVAKDIFAYLRLILNSNDDLALERIINKPKRYISKALIAEAKNNKKTTLLNAFFESKNIQSWQSDRLDELIYNLVSAKNKTTYEAFKYIRRIIGYDEYIKEYANFRKVNPKSLFEVLDEIQESAKGYDKIEEYLTHVEDVISEMKEQKTKRATTKEGVILSTMHSAKGLEFDIVFVTSAVEGVIPHEKSVTIDEIEEERRLFYVAITRAKKLLFISIIKTRYDQTVKPTRFLKKIIKTGEWLWKEKVKLIMRKKGYLSVLLQFF